MKAKRRTPFKQYTPRIAIVEKPLYVGTVVRLLIPSFEVGYITSRTFRYKVDPQVYSYDVQIMCSQSKSLKMVTVTELQLEALPEHDLHPSLNKKRLAMLKDLSSRPVAPNTLDTGWANILPWMAKYSSYKHYVVVSTAAQVDRMSDVLKVVGRRVLFIPANVRRQSATSFISIVNKEAPQSFDTVVLPVKQALYGWAVRHPRAALSCTAPLTEYENQLYQSRLRGEDSQIFVPRFRVS